MQNLSLKHVSSVALLAATGLAAALAATGPGSAAVAKNAPADGMPAHEVMTFDGPALLNPAGMTLYSDSNENTKSEKFRWQCTSAAARPQEDGQSGLAAHQVIGYKLVKTCPEKFPPYLAPAGAQPVGDFSIVQRPDGGRQWAYLGYPLYTSVDDHQPGERNTVGNGFGGVGRGGMRLAARPPQLPAGLKFMPIGETLVLASKDTGRPLYTPTGTGRLQQANFGDAQFLPVSAPAIADVRGDWTIVDDGAGRKQYSYRGKPLYAAPPGINDDEIAAAGGWESVMVFKGPALPAAFGKHLTLMGDVYTDKKGMTLYTYNCNASRGGTSCTDSGDPAAFMVALCGDGKECARRWHPYFAAPGARGNGIWSVVDITYPMFTDMHGPLYPADAPKVKAWAYRGKPVFTFWRDNKPGDIWGDRSGGVWGSSFSALQVPGRSAIYDN